MEIIKRTHKDTTMVELTGILDTNTSPKAQDTIQGYIDSGCRELIINLGSTEYMSSSGLRVLLVAAKKIWALSGKFIICQPNKLVRDILDTSGFSLIIEVTDTEEEALKRIT